MFVKVFHSLHNVNSLFSNRMNLQDLQGRFQLALPFACLAADLRFRFSTARLRLLNKLMNPHAAARFAFVVMTNSTRCASASLFAVSFRSRSLIWFRS